MVEKICIVCGKPFDARGRAKCCSPECSKINKKAVVDRYDKSEKGKAAHDRYNKSEKGKARRDRYNKSEKGKARQDRFYENNPGYNEEKVQKTIADLNEQYKGDLYTILEKCPTPWHEREAKMQVWFGESYCEGMIAKIKSTPVCEVTGEKTNDLVIHHLHSFNTHPELGNDPANMVRITKAVHKDFHKIYGYGDNTPEQWMEFVKNY